MIIKCSSTGEAITNENGSVIFKCPKCGKQTIVRSVHARKIATKYKCAECGFEGPN